MAPTWFLIAWLFVPLAFGAYIGWGVAQGHMPKWLLVAVFSTAGWSTAVRCMNAIAEHAGWVMP